MKLPLAKRIIYSVILSALSVVLILGCVEVVLRIAGFGTESRYYRIETDASGVRWYRENRWFTSTFFSKELVRRPPVMKIPVKKSKNTYRIFVLGGSAAMGDPEVSFSISRNLQKMLEDAYPSIHFEVINAAVTAINSSVLKYIAQDCSKLEPDLFIVYVGNNEVIGPFGPSAVFTPFMASPAWINFTVRVRESKIGQLITCMLKASEKNYDWGGMQMFLKQSITKNDPRLKDVYDLYRSNLQYIINSARSNEAEVFLCNVPTNIRDFAPFLSDSSKVLTKDEILKKDEFISQGDVALSSQDTGEALGNYLKAYDISQGDASIAYKVGRVLLGQYNIDEAGNYLKESRDLDLLRFRADSVLNQIIREVSESEDCQFVDLVNVASDNCEYGISGNEFFYEHVHLTMFGTYHVSCELFAKVSDQMLRDGLIQKKSNSLVSYSYSCMSLGYTPYDQALITFELVHRFENPPFIAQIDGASRLNEWRAKEQKILQLLTLPIMQNRIREMYLEAVQLHPDDWLLKRNFGMYLVAQNEAKEALVYLQNAYAWIADDPDTLYALACAYKETGNSQEKERYLKELEAIEPAYPNLSRLQ